MPLNVLFKRKKTKDIFGQQISVSILILFKKKMFSLKNV